MAYKTHTTESLVSQIEQSRAPTFDLEVTELGSGITPCLRYGQQGALVGTFKSVEAS